MLLALRISSMLALTLGCVLLAVAGIRWWSDDPQAAWSRNIPNVADRLAREGQPSSQTPGTSLLVARAEAFAAHLNPSAEPASPPSPQPEAAPEPQSVASAAPAATAALKLHATSCYPDQPEKSMALVSSGGAEPQAQRWVKERSQFGSFEIHEIRRGEIVCRQGDQLHQVAIEQPVDRPGIVRDIRGSSHKVSAAIDDAIRPLLPAPAGPNDVTITGN